MKYGKDIKKILKEYVNGLTEIIGEDLGSIILFGSYARGEQSQNDEISDIDIMILVNLDERGIKKIEDAILNYSYDLDLKYNIILSPIIENFDNYQSRKEYVPFYKNVAKEGVVLND